MGAFDAFLAGEVEAPLKYHPSRILFLTVHRYPVPGQRLLGSLTGAVASTANKWGALTATSEANLAVCWEVRLLVSFKCISVTE